MSKTRRKSAKTGGGATKRRLRVLLVTLIGLLVGLAALVQVAFAPPQTGEPVSFDRVDSLADQDRIVSARLLDETAWVVGVWCDQPVEPADGDMAAGSPSCPGTTQEFRASYPGSDVATQQLLSRLTESGATVTVDPQTPEAVARFAAMFVIPLAMLANLVGIVMLWQASDSSMSQITGFGSLGKKNKKNKKKTRRQPTTFADVAGADDVVTELREVTDYLANPARFDSVGAAPPRGVLLLGPPGCGKTLLARAVAGESGVSFFSAAGTEFVESLVGVGAARVRDLFAQVREAAPAIVFIDEIDALGRARGGQGPGSGGEREQTVNQLLVELDGFEVTSGIVLMGATNRPDILDPALMRPGRFDRHITINPPDVHGRQEMLALHARNRPVADDVDFAALARQTPGFTGADLANVVNEAALLAIRDGSGAHITGRHLSEAIQRVLHGPQRRGTLMTPSERHRIAVHEAGHALVAAALGHGDELHRVSIMARGRGLGQTAVGSDDDRVLHTAGELHSQLAMAMAGTAAETLMLDDHATTAADDLDRATRVAQTMVGRYGMSQLGFVRLLRGDNGHLPTDEPTLAPVSAHTLRDYDNEVRRLITSAHHTAMDALTSLQSELDTLVAALEDRETLEGDHLHALLPSTQPMPPGGRQPLVATPNGTTVHRPDCPTVADRPQVHPVNREDDNYKACGHCRPYTGTQQGANR